VLGALLSLLSAATFGMNVASLRRGVLKGSVLQALAITVIAGVPLFALGCLAVGGYDALFGFSRSQFGWFAAAGAVHFIVGRYGNYRATRVLGAAQSGPIQQLSLIISLSLAIIFLGERLTLLSALGIILILFAPLVLVGHARRKGGVKTRAGQKLDYVDGYFWGIICAVSFGTSPLLIRFGLEERTIAESAAGGLVSYVAATLVIALILTLPGKIAHMREMERKTVGWFAAAGVLVFISQMLLYMALALAPVSIVMAVQRTSLVFRVIFSWLLNRDHEVLGLSALVGIGISALGVVFVTTDVDTLVKLVPLSPAIADSLRISWP
jgi:drug/metabolite transporter (DMT)-like permease